ncbi:hypothetical protein Tco_1353019 [Tanacetum coccineum]
MISNEFVVKLCLEHEVTRGNKVVKKELIVSLRGEIYFVKFIINPEEDDVEPGVVFGRSFLRLTKEIADFGNETITIYPELDPFLVSSEEEEKISDDWDLLLDVLDVGDIPDIEGVNVSQFVCNMGKSSRNKRKQLEIREIQLIYSDMRPQDALIVIGLFDKHLDTIPEPESDELIKSSVEDLVHTPSESDGISESECDLPVCDDSSPKKDEVLDDIISIPPGNGNDHFNAESSLIESVLNHDNMISSPKIDFLLEEFADKLVLIASIPPRIVEADFDPKGDIHFIENLMYDNSFPRPPETLNDDSKTVIDSNNDYSSSDNDSLYSDDIDYVEASPPDSELVSLEMVEIVIPEVGGIDTNILLTIKDDILCENLLNANLLIAKIEAFKDNPTPSPDFIIPTREPRVHVPNVLPTYPTLQLDSDFTLSSDSLGSDLVVSFPSGTRNKSFDLGIFIEVQSKRFLSPNEFSISFIRDPLSPVFDTLLPFSSKNGDNVFNPSILASNEEKSPHHLSHQGFKAFQLISESPMLIYGEDIPILDVPFLHFYMVVLDLQTFPKDQ